MDNRDENGDELWRGEQPPARGALPPVEVAKQRAAEKLEREKFIGAFRAVHDALEPMTTGQRERIVRAVCILMEIDVGDVL